jgi:hypothetical protein
LRKSREFWVFFKKIRLIVLNVLSALGNAEVRKRNEKVQSLMCKGQKTKCGMEARKMRDNLGNLVNLAKILGDFQHCQGYATLPIGNVGAGERRRKSEVGRRKAEVGSRR